MAEGKPVVLLPAFWLGHVFVASEGKRFLAGDDHGAVVQGIGPYVVAATPMTTRYWWHCCCTAGPGENQM